MEGRFAAIEGDVRDIKTVLGRLEPLLARMNDLVQRMDERMERMDERMRKVEVDIGELKGRVSQLPTTIQVFTYMTGLLAFGIALSGAILGFLRLSGH